MEEYQRGIRYYSMICQRKSPKRISQADLFVAAKKQRSAAVRAMLAHQTDPSLSVAKSDEVFAEQTHAHGRTIGIGNFLSEQSGNPIAPE
jgi:hypothetical protein